MFLLSRKRVPSMFQNPSPVSFVSKFSVGENNRLESFLLELVHRDFAEIEYGIFVPNELRLDKRLFTLLGVGESVVSSALGSSEALYRVLVGYGRSIIGEKADVIELCAVDKGSGIILVYVPERIDYGRVRYIENELYWAESDIVPLFWYDKNNGFLYSYVTQSGVDYSKE